VMLGATGPAAVAGLFDFNNTTAALAHVETVSSVAADFVGTVKSGSEIEIDAAGKFLYVSNRTDHVAHGNVGAYAISQVTASSRSSSIIKLAEKHTPVQFVAGRESCWSGATRARITCRSSR
jgi:6-phosphogluconolactonase (cycloisomerase 2 family)